MENITIAMHNIELYLDVTDVEWLENDNDIELNEINEEHIKNAINQGYREGELLQVIYKDENDEEGEEVRGWWKIKFD